MMNGRPHDRAQPARESAVMHGDLAPRAPRIRIDVPLGTPYREIRDSILRQAWELAGTQLRAAIALGITPETVSRTLRRSKPNQDVQPSGHNLPRGNNPANGQRIRRGRSETESGRPEEIVKLGSDEEAETQGPEDDVDPSNS